MKRTQGNMSNDLLTENASFIPMEVIRRRVARIKNRWTPEIANSRAAEGRRRREELECLLSDLLAEETSVADDVPHLSLVG
ncbi:MAG: hypothetical protein KDB22_03290 [Planctomycetales bacterium]|nr:hypothetical protein [Planctomycetales bacterium]